MDENVYNKELSRLQNEVINGAKDGNITIRINSKIKDEYIRLFGRTMSNKITTIMLEQIAEELAKRVDK